MALRSAILGLHCSLPSSAARSMRATLQEKAASSAKAAGLQAAGSPPAAARRGSCPAAAQRARLKKRPGSRELPRAGRQDSGASPGPEQGLSGPRAAGGCARAALRSCVRQVSSSAPLRPPGSPSRVPRGAGRGRSPGAAEPFSPSATAGALPAGPHLASRVIPPSLLSTGAYPFSLQSSQRSAASLLSLVQRHFQQEGAARPQPEAAFPSGPGASGARARRRSGPARRGEPGAGGSPGPTAALELTRVLMRRRGPARPAQHIPACPRPPGMRRLGSGPKSDLRWRFGRSALLASFFGERALK